MGFRDEFRAKRNYEKVDEHFWAVEKSQRANAKKQRIELEHKEADSQFNANRQNDVDYENMTVSQIKDKLQELGVKTRLKLKQKLIDLLKKELNSKSDK